MSAHQGFFVQMFILSHNKVIFRGHAGPFHQASPETLLYYVTKYIFEQRILDLLTSLLPINKGTKSWSGQQWQRTRMNAVHPVQIRYIQNIGLCSRVLNSCPPEPKNDLQWTQGRRVLTSIPSQKTSLLMRSRDEYIPSSCRTLAIDRGT